MNPGYLIDKSALARMPLEPVRSRLAPILESGAAASCGIIELEVIFSTRSFAEHQETRDRRQLSYRQIPMTQEVFDRAIHVQGELARTGRHRVPIQDLLIAATAEVAELVVLHYDRDFDVIAEVTGQSVEWVVPRGTV